MSEKPSIVQRTKTYAVCPACGQDAGCVDHLLGRDFQTWWYCDHCGQRYSLAFSRDGRVTIASAPGRKVVTTDVLILPPQSKPVYFVVPGMRFEGKDAPEDQADAQQFFYEEHSCPTNWLKPEMVYFDGDSDPHGLIEFVKSVDTETLPADEMVSPNDHDAALIELIEAAHV